MSPGPAVFPHSFDVFCGYPPSPYFSSYSFLSVTWTNLAFGRDPRAQGRFYFTSNEDTKSREGPLTFPFQLHHSSSPWSLESPACCWPLDRHWRQGAGGGTAEVASIGQPEHYRRKLANKTLCNCSSRTKETLNFWISHLKFVSFSKILLNVNI